MKNAILVHIEIGIEYYKNGNLFVPTTNEKLMWTLFGTPEGVERYEMIFETEIDNFTGFSKQDVQAKVNENFAKGLYSFLPAMGFDQNVELRY